MKTKFLQRVLWLMIPLLTILTIGVSQVKAALRSDWTLVTTVDQLTSGGTFIIANVSGSPTTNFTCTPMRNETSATTDANGYMYSGTTAGSTTSGTIDMEDGTIDTSPYEVTIEAGSSNGTISIKLKSGTYKDYYIVFSGTSNHNLKMTTTKNSNSSFTPTYTSSRWHLQCAGRTSRYFKYWNGSNNYRFTNAGNNSDGSYWLVIYKKTGKTYHEWDGSSSFSTSAGGSTLKAVPSLCDWAIEPYGWCSEENYASSSYPTSKIWFKDASWPAGKTDLYALYRVGNNPYYYSTKPSIYTVTYNLTNVSKDDSYSYVCTSNIVNQVGTNFIEAYFEPASGYMLDASCISITMGGSPVSSSNYDWNPDYSYPDYDYTAQLFMENITGNIVVTVTAKLDCDKTVTPTAGTKTNVSTIAFNKASLLTCSSTASDRQVTVTITPSSCYAVPSSTRLTVTGTSATYVSGPTDNGNGTYSFVYQFAQNATGTSTFAASLSTKTTYTVNYNKGTYGTGDNSSATKTCGVNLALPSSAMFTRTGYTQQGWSTAAAGNTKTYNMGANYTTDAGTTLYPYWQVNSYSVTWKVNNGNYSAGGSSSVNHGSHISTLPTAPDPGDYCGDKFVGWTDAAGGDFVYGTSNLYTTASQFPNATGDQIFYAVFADYDD